MKNSHKSVYKIRFNDLIIEDTKDYTILNKPPFISTLKDRNDTRNILGIAREVNENYQVCHRLDKETSGVIVLAKNADAYRNFALQLEHREIKKIYHAVIQGLHKFQDFEADEPLYTTTNKSRVDFKMGKPSLTLISTLELFKKSSLIKCFPFTGRMHQIRAHLSYHNAPIVHDAAYGGADLFLADHKRNFKLGKYEDPKPMINRIPLHAHAIAFRNMENEIVEVEAVYPKDFSSLIKQLKKYN